MAVSAEGVSPEEVTSVLHTILDPCAVNAGVPISIVDMGLVHDVVIEPGDAGSVISLAVSVTEPTCVMYHHFAVEADRKLRELDGVAEVRVTVQPYRMWTEDSIEPEARIRLASVRAARRVSLPIPTRSAGSYGSGSCGSGS
jgi:metal-sulfur cluster biosynthetic enzyme